MKSRTATSDIENLPNAELEVMASLWQQGEATVRQIREAMATYRPMTHGAVVTLLKRLEAKELVVKAKGDVGKAFVYTPTLRPSSAYRRVIGKLLERVFGGNSVTLVASLFETKPPSPEELDELERLLDQLRQRTQEKGAPQ